MSIPSYRSCSAGETLQRVSPFLSRLGITRVSSQTGLDKIGIPVWCAYAPNARAIVIAQGKGIDDVSARTSAVMEAVERSVATQPVCDTIQASIADLAAQGSDFDRLDGLLAAKMGLLLPHEQLQWVCGRDLLTGNTIRLPYEAVHLDRTVDGRRYWQSSDGLASGNSRNEAVLHGLLERVERDALALWQLDPVEIRHNCRIDPAEFIEEELIEMLQRIERAGLQIALFDITSDLGIACITAILGPRDPPPYPPVRHVDITLGCGAALQPELAASRAISEAVQSRMTFIAGARDDLLPDLFEEKASPHNIAALGAPLSRRLQDMPRFAVTSATEGLEVLLQWLAEKKAGPLYAVDLAPDWLPVSVVKVIAPHLENPEGERRQRFGPRAIRKALS